MLATTPTLPAYAELHCLSNFSFLRGASRPEELVARAAELGYSALAITDECSLAGVVRAHAEAKQHNLHLIIGTELTLADGLRLVLLACNRYGYGNLSELISLGRRNANKGRYRLERADVLVHSEACVALHLPGDQPTLADARWFAQNFAGRAWMAAELLLGHDDAGQLKAIQQIASAIGIPLVAASDVHYHIRSRGPLQDVLTAIRLGKPVAQCGHSLFPNTERHLRSRVTLASVYPQPLLAETVRIARLCTFSLDELRYEYPDEIVAPGETPQSYFRQVVEAGLKRRYPAGASPETRRQIEHELRLIRDLDYEPYFLTVYDVVRFARERGILCQGRGSAANSAVCYVLGITEIDPVRSNLLFERFISKERNEPPDIDVDFEHDRREEVIQYIYQRYGRDRAAIAATVITYRSKSAIRDVGKALGFSPTEVDRLAKQLAWWDRADVLPERIREAGLDPEDRRIQLLVRFVRILIGFPRHLSQHVGGFVIARDRLTRLVPVENAAMPDRTIIQWDKDDLDALGLLKVDVLALGMLSVIRRSLELIGGYRGKPMTMADIPAEDAKVYDMVCKADTIGVFQIESRAQMAMLPRLKPRNFYDLVIEIAMIRPGPIQGGMVHPYLRRLQGLEPVEYPSEEVKHVLERTLGVPIFQEQVMKLAIVAAGFSPGEADLLRRSMTSWRKKGGIAPMQQKLYDGMVRRGYSPEFAEQIQNGIVGFGEYGFPESHSASFALLAYASAWLKCHEPAAFLAALLNSQPMGFYAPSQLIQDAIRHGVEVRAVDVSVSDWNCALEPTTSTQPAVRLGLRMVRGLSRAAALRIAESRRVQPFANIRDLANRAQVNKRDLACLADAGALQCFAEHRRLARWAAAGVQILPGLLREAPIQEELTQLAPPNEAEDIYDDYHSLGFTLGRHPVSLIRERLRRMKSVSAEDLQRLPNNASIKVTGIVTCRQRPETASGIVFLTLEDETGHMNIIVWGSLADEQRDELLRARLLTIVGKLQREGDIHHVIARRLIDHSTLLGNLRTEARDFG